MGTADSRSSHTFVGEGVGLTEGEISALHHVCRLMRYWEIESVLVGGRGMELLS